MANLGGFKREDAPVDEFEVLPAGTYEAIIAETNMTPYKSGEGEYLQCIYEIIGENGKGRKIFDVMNLWHKNPVASKISWTSMGKILDALGMLSVDDSNELCNKPMTIDLEIDGTNNRIKKWHSAGVATPSAVVAAAPEAVSAPSQPSSNKAPWE